jgi:AraC-like DNA-binding protein
MDNSIPRIKTRFGGKELKSMPIPVENYLSGLPHMQDFIVTNVGYYTDTRGKKAVRPLGLADHTLILVAEGSGWAKFGKTTWEVPKDHLLLIPAHCPHEYALHEEDPWHIYWMSFTGRGTDQLLKLTPFSEACPVIPCAAIPRVLQQFDTAVSTINTPYNEAAHMERSRCLINILSFQHASEGQTLHSGTVDRIEAVMAHMSEHVHQPEPLLAYAQRAGFSVPYFSEVFRNHCGVSPIHYFAGLRIRRACELIVQTDLQIGQIADELGFEDRFYFSRLFKKQTGMSPSDYRKHMGGC